MAVDEAGELVIFGGSDGAAGVYSLAESKVQQSFKVSGAITDAVWYGSQPVVSTSSGAIKVFGPKEITFSSHAGSANALAFHPCGEILASVGVDKSFTFYDLVEGKAVTQIFTDSCKRHPLFCTKAQANKMQHSLQLLSTPMGTSLQLVALTARSSYSMSKPERALRIST